MTAMPTGRKHSRALARYTYFEYLDLREPGMYHDGGGLYLHVSPSGAKSWMYRYMIGGHARAMGLGSFRFVSLKKARKKAYEAGEMLEDGVDPLEARTQLNVVIGDSQKTFQEFALDYIASREKDWRGSSSSGNWKYTLETYAYPIFGSMLPQTINVTHVRAVIDPIWDIKTQTAKRLLNRIETVIDYARAHDPLRDELGRWKQNPAHWEGLWDKLKDSPKRTAPVSNLRAIKYTSLGEFMRDLARHDDYLGARPLELLICTASRSKMILGARWPEVDLEQKTWTVPAARMKNEMEFCVPLGARAVEILREMERVRENDCVFPGGADGHASHVVMWKLLKLIKWDDRTVVHGFRSTFRSWAADETDHADNVCEMALAHEQGDATYAAYQRGDLLRKRRLLMNDWNDFVVSGPLAA